MEQLFGCVGMIKNVPEKAMDAVVGVSGSGPAYVYQFIGSLCTYIYILFLINLFFFFFHLFIYSMISIFRTGHNLGHLIS